ncbi:hypothetical protein AB1Y20_021031 [Prymnesium parvum]|uniref:PUB domain-containing protein n=1 Tax=Prymnesium parvum TaxID=97485 RepID=A0AB34JL42_PRYPA
MEFRSLQAKLEHLENALQLAECGVLQGSNEHAEALNDAHALLTEIKPRALVFERRAREKDPDKQIYGPGMTQKVLDFCERLSTASGRAEQLEEELAPLRARLAAELATKQHELDESEQQERQQLLQAEQRVFTARPTRGQQAGSLPMVKLQQTPGVDREGGRRRVLSGMSLADALPLLERSCPDARALAEAMQNLHLLCANVVAHPDEDRFRAIQLQNPAFQQAIAIHPGGLEALVAIGFRERESTESEECSPVLVLEEPNLGDNVEAWYAWYERLKTCRDELQAFMERLHVPVLPAARKSAREEVDAFSGCLCRNPATLHGQASGGL